jgi:hypothetical protein
VILHRPFSVAIFLSTFFKSLVLQLLEFVVDGFIIVIVDGDAGEMGIISQFYILNISFMQ